MDERPGEPVGGWPTVVRRATGVEIPEAPEGAVILVSSMVLDAVQALGVSLSNTVVAPDTGPTAVRNAQGQVVAVTRLVRPSSMRTH